MKFFHADIQLIIDEKIIIGFHTLCFLGSAAQAGLDDLLSLGAPAGETVFQLIPIGRSHKKKKGIRAFLTHLQCSLDLDLKDHVFAPFQLLVHIGLRRSVIVIAVSGILQKSVLTDHLFKLFI